jgi:hypothetical protein
MKRVKIITAVLAAGVLLVVLLVGMAGMDAAPSFAQSGRDAAYVVMHSATITNGNGTAVTPNTMDAAFSALTVQAVGPVSGTLNFEGTINGATFVALIAENVSTAATGTTTTAAGVFRLDVTGLSSVRVRVSGITTTTTDSITVVGWLSSP